MEEKSEKCEHEWEAIDEKFGGTHLEMRCKECGEDTCYVFGVKLLSGEKDLSQCPHVDVSELERTLNPIRI